MLIGLYIFLDDEFEDPIYADPDPGELEGTQWEATCEAANDALDEERESHGVISHADFRIGWNAFVKQGVTFVAIVTRDVKGPDIERYLGTLSKRYMDEVDDPRNPERDGVEDVVVDVVPPWEDGDEE